LLDHLVGRASSIGRRRARFAERNVMERDLPHSGLIPAPLMIGHHFSISAFWCARSASGVCCSGGNTRMPLSPKRERTAPPPQPVATAELSLSTTSLGVPFGAQRPLQLDT